MKKKIAAMISVLAMTFMLAACGNQGTSNNATVAMPENKTESAESTDAAEGTEPSQQEDRVLVAYYSYTGTTEKVANQIAELTGADTAKIDRAEPYPEDVNEAAENEIKSGARPEITVSVEDISSYDTIFVGYPVWYDEAPAMIATFLENNDFSGKTIIPFCTSSSDEIENSLHIFEELCPDADIAEGLTANQEEDIEPWLEGLGLLKDTSGAESEGTGSGTANASAGNSNILLTYFTVMMDEGTVDAVGRASRVATDQEVLGNTEYLSHLIRQELGGDLFRIEPVEEYQVSDMDAVLERAYKEKQENARPALKQQVENLEQYDIVFIGFPNWNADLPMPIYTFLEGVDLSGKTIVPFVVHGGSGFSRTVSTIQELQPNATVLTDGFSISRDDVISSGADIIEWAKSLNLAE